MVLAASAVRPVTICTGPSRYFNAMAASGGSSEKHRNLPPLNFSPQRGLLCFFAAKVFAATHRKFPHPAYRFKGFCRVLCRHEACTELVNHPVKECKNADSYPPPNHSPFLIRGLVC